MKQPLIYAILAILFLGLLWIILPQTNSGDLKEYARKELILKDSLKRLVWENKTLKSRDSVNAVIVEIQRDSVAILKKSSQRKRVVYLQARTATDIRPDSTNLALEVKESRIYIDTLKTEINALDELVVKLDIRIASQKGIIDNQGIQLITWETRFKNLEELRDIQVAKERRRGNGKFLKGLGIGVAIMAILAL